MYEIGQVSRRKERNIRIEPTLVSAQTSHVMDAAAYWIANQLKKRTKLTIWPHHKLIPIHRIQNSHGRHAKMMVDLVLFRLGQPAVTWTGESISYLNVPRFASVRAL